MQPRPGSPRRSSSELESYGLVAGRGTGASATYTDGDLAIARAAAGFLQHGIDARHLAAWRQAAEREAALFEQLILPLLRQRNPQARQQGGRNWSPSSPTSVPNCVGASCARHAAPPPRRVSSATDAVLRRARRGYAPIVIPMELVGVRVEVPANTPVVILREQAEPHRVLPILIGTPEASAIHTALSRAS